MGHDVETRKCVCQTLLSFPLNFVLSAAHTMICDSFGDKLVRKNKMGEKKTLHDHGGCNGE